LIPNYILSNLNEARINLFRNKTRTLLTSLGIIIGITSVIILIAITNGAKSVIETQLTSLGAKTIMLKPFVRTASGQTTGRGQNFTEEELELIKSLDSVDYLAPIVKASQEVNYRSISNIIALVGSNADFAAINDWNNKSGSFITQNDVNDGTKVCVLGLTNSRRFFGAENPIGKKLRINGVPHLVIGVLEPKGLTPGGRDQDDFILLPYTSLNRLNFRPDLSNVVSVLMSARSSDELEYAKFSIKKILRETRSLKPGEDNFDISSYEGVTKRILNTTKILRILLTSIASISLIVGGIGIMNIMLVSVTERTKEIGIRITIGAKSKDIVFQFLCESALLSLIGGIVGVMLGFIISKIASTIIGWPAIVSLSSIMISFFFSGGIGVFFGIYPAFKASKLDPILAIRNE
tara:strand:- start:2259 stop:3479 length:1221 start_codon:yes stop_codon:yes gene_type:complete